MRQARPVVWQSIATFVLTGALALHREVARVNRTLLIGLGPVPASHVQVGGQDLSGLGSGSEASNEQLAIEIADIVAEGMLPGDVPHSRPKTRPSPRSQPR